MNARASWQALIVALVLPVSAASAQRVTSVAEMVEELNAGVPAAQVLKHLALDCGSFRLDTTGEAQIRQAGGDEAFIRGVRETCAKGVAQLQVTSNPAGAQVRLDGRALGTTPFSGTVPVATLSTIEVQLGNQRRSTQTELVGGQKTIVSFEMPRDTVAWTPGGRSAMQVAMDLGIMNEFQAPPGRPEPPKLRGSGGGGRSFLFMLLGAGAGYAFGAYGPSGCVDKQTITRDAYVGDTFYPAGSEVDLGKGMPCVGGAAGLGAAGGLIFSLPINAAVGSSRRGTYKREMEAYPARLAAWESSAREAWVASHPRVLQAMEQERLAASTAEANNRQIAVANASLPDPSISREALPVAAPVRIATQKESVASDVDVNIPKGVAPNPNAIAVVIGNRNYESNDVPAVDYAIRDAQTMKKYLVEAFGFNEDNIIYAEDAKVSKFLEIFGSPTDERGKLHNFVTTAREKPDVFVFYSGHGAPDLNTGKGYLVPSDANPNFIGQNGYPIEALYKNLAKLPIRSLTIALDACFSGGSEKGALIKAASPLYISVDNVLLTAPGAVGFTAAGAREVSSWFEEKGHGLFTYYFLKGLQGDADSDGDRAITGKELGEFVKDNVLRNARRTKNREQNPQLIGKDLDRVIVRLQSSGTR
jgi:hypothetical protein